MKEETSRARDASGLKDNKLFAHQREAFDRVFAHVNANPEYRMRAGPDSTDPVRKERMMVLGKNDRTLSGLTRVINAKLDAIK